MVIDRSDDNDNNKNIDKIIVIIVVWMLVVGAWAPAGFFPGVGSEGSEGRKSPGRV